MILLSKTVTGKNLALLEAILVISGICLFALFVHKNNFTQLFSITGLIITGVVITRSEHDFSSLLLTLGIVPPSNKITLYIIVGLIFGSTLGLFYRFIYEDFLLPQSLTKFAIIASLIGIVEELVFRGYVQTKTASKGVLFSIVFASFGHTLYKYLVINTLPLDLGISPVKLVLLTFLSGVIVGILRSRSKSIYPSAISHALFDIVVYGSASVAPVWVWG